HDQLPGLNVEMGLSRIGGDWSAYQNLLKRFQKNYQDFVTQLQTLFDEQKQVQAQRFIHTLKGAAGNIGADQLYQISAHLEQTLRDQKNLTFSELRQDWLSLQQELQQVQESITDLLTDETSLKHNKISSQISDFSEVLAIVSNITELLETNLADAIDYLEALKQRTQGTSWHRAVQEIDQNLADFDTDRAQQLLVQMARNIEREEVHHVHQQTEDSDCG
ncbi:MAG: Hpt domain-containing protein, partial [Halothece sp. Uz-M2-17]|nr:Hpt domain-containing protein [Halothece sp. Uz-M2-17]